MRDIKITCSASLRASIAQYSSILMVQRLPLCVFFVYLCVNNIFTMYIVLMNSFF